MCGIAGFLADGDPGARGDTLRRMTRSLRHRGPDDEGFYLDEFLALGARRLCVIDPPTGCQPMANEDGTVWVVHNGEIYNFQDLRARLQRLGHRAQDGRGEYVIIADRVRPALPAALPMRLVATGLVNRRPVSVFVIAGGSTADGA